MKGYYAQVDHSGELIDVHFTTDGSPIEYLWERYGMSSYIASLVDVAEAKGTVAQLSEGGQAVALGQENTPRGTKTDQEQIIEKTNS